MDADVRQRLLAATFSFARAQLTVVPRHKSRHITLSQDFFKIVFYGASRTVARTLKFTIFRPTCRHVDEQNGVTTETAHFVEVFVHVCARSEISPRITGAIKTKNGIHSLPHFIHPQTNQNYRQENRRN